MKAKYKLPWKGTNEALRVSPGERFFKKRNAAGSPISLEKHTDTRPFCTTLRKASQRSRAKNCILLEAAKAITSTGYEQCTLQGIASKVGLSRPALYYYFSTKQEIFSAIALTSAGSPNLFTLLAHIMLPVFAIFLAVSNRMLNGLSIA